METDILGAIHKKVVQAVEQGETFYEFKKNLIERLGESGWGNYKEKDRMTGETITRLSDSRLRKIYETNTTQAYHAGAWRGFEETKEALPYLEYKLGPSVHHRDSHAQFNGLILKVDDPFWDTHMPMNGWGCKCWVRQLTEAQAKAKGISKSPKIDYHEWVNPSTGEVKKVPKGLSPGFEYNVGKNRKKLEQILIAQTLDKATSLSPQRALKVIKELTQGKVQGVNTVYFDKAYNALSIIEASNKDMPLIKLQEIVNYKLFFSVGRLNEQIKKVLDTKAEQILLSEQTIIKQIRHHIGQQIDKEKYILIEQIINNYGEIVQIAQKKYSFFTEYQNNLYKVVVKKTSNDELLMVSFLRLQKMK